MRVFALQTRFVFAIFMAFFCVRLLLAGSAGAVESEPKFFINSEHGLHELEVKRFGGVKKLQLSVFENEPAFCPSEFGSLPDEFFCIYADAGAHGQTLQIFDKKRLVPIEFHEDGLVLQSIYSDFPMFEITKEGIVSYFRDYDLDPLQSVIKRHYRLSEGDYRFDREENFTYY